MGNKKKSGALMAGLWYLISNFLLKGLSFITTPLFTRMLSTNDFGITSTYNSYVGMFMVISTLDLYSCVQISKQDFSEENNKFVSSVLFLSSSAVAGTYVVVNGICLLWGNIFRIPEVLIDVMFLNIMFSNAFNIMQTHHRADFKYKQVTILSILSSVCSTLLSLLFVYHMQSDRYLGRAAGELISIMIIGLYAMIYVMYKGRCCYKKQYWRYALKVSVPLIPHHLSGNILSYFDQIMINRYCGATDVAFYSLAYNCGLILQVLWSSLNGAWSPWFFDRMKENNIVSIKKYVRPYLLGFSILVLGVIACTPEIIFVLGPKEYRQSIWVVPPVAIGVFFQFVYSLYVNIEFYYKKTTRIATGTMLSALINVVLNVLLIPVVGYIAAAYTTLAGYFFLFLFHYNISKKLEKRDIYDKRYIIGTVLFTVLAGCIFAILYKFSMIRYLIAILLIAILLRTAQKSMFA